MTEYDKVNPDEAARSIFAAQRMRRWLDVADSVHPDTATRLKRSAVLFAVEEENQRANELLSARDEEAIKDQPYWYRHWYGVFSIQELEELSPREVIARIVEHKSPASINEVLGHVMEPPDTAHVVYRCSRIREDGQKTVAIELLTLKFLRDRWYAVSTGHLPAFWQAYHR